ncbi:MAG: sn-glycerol-3-phosphate ABC transporter ATP-binding protein UgpC [Cyanobacteria bacterium J06623_7]
MAKVRLQGITRQFDNVTAIEDISLQIPDREFWVLVGPSGCGKSTVLRTIAGLESITRGELYIGDRLVNDIPARQRDVAMVFQNYALYPHMTVRDNLAFGLKMRGVPSAEMTRKIQEVAHSLDIKHLLKRKPKQLSGGQQQRVALGRAIVRQPQVFLLDEPLSNLDAQLRDDTRIELKRLHQQFQITTIYVTHDRVEAMTLADRIVVLANGKVQQIDTPQEIYSQPRNSMVASFLGNPPMNILPGVVTGDQVTLLGSSISVGYPKGLSALSPGQKVQLGIRPEHIEIFPNSAEGEDCLQVEVDLVEPLGRETLIKVKIAGTSLGLNLIADSHYFSRRGDRLNIRWESQHLYLFDLRTGEVIADR